MMKGGRGHDDDDVADDVTVAKSTELLESTGCLGFLESLEPLIDRTPTNSRPSPLLGLFTLRFLSGTGVTAPSLGRFRLPEEDLNDDKLVLVNVTSDIISSSATLREANPSPEDKQVSYRS